jgi:two-component system, NtrC family, sensor histidine kinase PilS
VIKSFLNAALESLSSSIDRRDFSRVPPNSYWRSLAYFNIYRLIVGLLLGILTWYSQDRALSAAQHQDLFYAACFGSSLTALIGVVGSSLRRPAFIYQLAVTLIADTLFITLMIYASGGIGNGLELMLFVTLAAGGLIGRGRLAMFYASLATLAVLLEETMRMLAFAEPPQYLQTGLLSVGYFAVAWLAHTLAQYTRESEKLAEQRGVDLANLAQVNEMILRDMADGVIVVDNNGAIRTRNGKTEDLLGPLPIAMGEPRLKEYSPELAEWLAGWRSNPTNRFMLMRSPVATKQMRVRFVPIGDQSIQGTVIFLEDLAQEQAQARQIKLAALGRLTGNIAHEIRNPLSSISHATELLQENDLDPTEQKLCRIIRENTERLGRMVSDVLELNRSDRAKPEELESHAYLEGFLEQLRQVEKIAPEIISLELNVRGTLYFDPNHLHQILWNLTRNALRHCKMEAGSVRVCLNRTPQPGMLQLDVMDDGPGVPTEMLNRLFEPFFTTESQGTGLGLYIARELAEANNAALEYVELAPGAHFRVLLRSEP